MNTAMMKIYQLYDRLRARVDEVLLLLLIHTPRLMALCPGLPG